jgi:hypothetical protein
VDSDLCGVVECRPSSASQGVVTTANDDRMYIHRGKQARHTTPPIYLIYRLYS